MKTRLAALAALSVVLAGHAGSRAQVPRTPPSASAAPPAFLETPEGAKPRVVITTDPELDDSNSLIRYLLYSSDFRTEGLIYASSQFHWKGDGKGTKLSVPGREYTRFGLHICPCTSYRWAPDERYIDAAVDAYAEAYPNLRVHDAGYPTPPELRSKIRWGNVEFDGDMSKDTPGSDLIKSLLLDDEESPVYLHAWGGQSTIARALKSIEDQYKDTPQWAAIRAKVIRKAVIHPSGDQDDTYATYIRPHWPEIRYRALIGGIDLAYDVQDRASEADAAYFTAAWTRANVSTRGAFGRLYRVWGDGKQMVKGDVFDYFGLSEQGTEALRKQGYIVWSPLQEKGAFIGEGDTPTFLNLIDNGLRGYRGDSLGGWGGHARRGPAPATGSLGGLFGAPKPARAPTNPFLAAAQRDFAARLVWATTPDYAKANHEPRITLESPRVIRARPGQRVRLRVRTSDPDGNTVEVRWWRWDQADTYSGVVVLDRSSGLFTGLRVPADAKPGDTIQLVAEASDNGVPALTRYERAVVLVAD
jgi:hypothetical protein